ncbi:hypothetical protein [Adhaeretor mobilis]|uniref:Uncharacterized protein n=1 Tax=Adhaeretor mobilis TaxID=1930276 RepID=A0A517MTA0_9BACT|nr:hypothetical protein [Adhaeretor mobilis]QDS98105.1 hypothetical protein HG15A2_13770 [Adhaeretor mobilis]
MKSPSPALRSRLFVAPLLLQFMLFVGVVCTHSLNSQKATAQDQIFLVSTRGIGTKCSSKAMQEGLRCEQLTRDTDGELRWHASHWNKITDDSTPTVIYVHGNRIPSGIDKPHGLQVYTTLCRSQATTPLRFIIWSWPSEQIRGQLKDYQVKAARTRPVGWQLAWAVDQLSAETPVGIVGYSYGARVATGTLHLLAGGSLNGLKLTQRRHPQRAPIPTVLIAAATNQSWLSPRGYHGRAGRMMDSLMLVNNRHDPAMKFYALGIGQRGARALGYEGIAARSLTKINGKFRSYDATKGVGRDHSLHKYLAAVPQIAMLKQQVASQQVVSNTASATYKQSPRS